MHVQTWTKKINIKATALVVIVVFFLLSKTYIPVLDNKQNKHVFGCRFNLERINTLFNIHDEY